MKIMMNDDTAAYIVNDLHAASGDDIRFFVRMGGCSTVQDGFSLGITKDTPKHPAAELRINDHNFFIEEEDEWFFDGKDLTVTLKNNEIQFEFHDKNE